MVKDIHELEFLISHLLSFGVFISVLLIGIGVALYSFWTGIFNLILSEEWVLKGGTVFEVFSNVIGSILLWSNPPFAFMSLGILMLMLTQYIRVILSVIYFLLAGDWKYVVITLTVLIILTLSLLNILRAG